MNLGWLKLLQTCSINCPVWSPSPWPHFNHITQAFTVTCSSSSGFSLFSHRLFGCLLPATSTIKYSQVFLSPLLPCMESKITIRFEMDFLHSHSGQVLTFFFFFYTTTKQVHNISSNLPTLPLFSISLQCASSVSISLFFKHLFSVIQKVEMYCMTIKCREFYCTQNDKK